MDIATSDRLRLQWLAEHLSHAMVVLDGTNTMSSLRNNGIGWRNGELEAALDNGLRGSLAYWTDRRRTSQQYADEHPDNPNNDAELELCDDNIKRLTKQEGAPAAEQELRDALLQWEGLVKDVRLAIAAFCPANEHIEERDTLDALNVLFRRIANGHWPSEPPAAKQEGAPAAKQERGLWYCGRCDCPNDHEAGACHDCGKERDDETCRDYPSSETCLSGSEAAHLRPKGTRVVKAAPSPAQKKPVAEAFQVCSVCGGLRGEFAGTPCSCGSAGESKLPSETEGCSREAVSGAAIQKPEKEI